MKDVDCAFLKPCPPTRARIVERPAISTAELVKLWQKSGVITHYKPRKQVNPGDVMGLIALAVVLAFCSGYLFGAGGF